MIILIDTIPTWLLIYNSYIHIGFIGYKCAWVFKLIHKLILLIAISFMQSRLNL